MQRISIDYYHLLSTVPRVRLVTSYKSYVGLHVKCILFLSDFNQTWILPAGLISVNTDSVKFHGNPSSGSRVRPWGQTERETWPSWWSLFAILLKCLKRKQLFRNWAYSIPYTIECVDSYYGLVVTERANFSEWKIWANYFLHGSTVPVGLDILIFKVSW
jgi:hypothetical protein